MKQEQPYGLIVLFLTCCFLVAVYFGCNSPNTQSNMQRMAVMTKGDSLAFELKSGKRVKLQPGVYDMSNYNSIPVQYLTGCKGATIIANTQYSGAGKDTTCLFNLMDNGVMDSVYITGANKEIGTNDYSNVWGAVKICGTSASITNSSFTACDKWAIYVRGDKKGPGIINIKSCDFSFTRRVGYGYAIWNQYGIVFVDSCNFHDNRHDMDGSSVLFSTTCTNSTFDYGNYIHINMHGYSDGFRGGNGVLIDKCKFYDLNTPLTLKLPYDPTKGMIGISRCDFACAPDKLGLIADTAKIYGYTNPQFKMADCTYNGQGLLPAPIINGLDSLRVGQTTAYKVSGYNSYVWHTSAEGGKITVTPANAMVTTLSCYGVNGRERSLTGYKTIVVTDTGSYYGFWYKVAGSTKLSVLKDGKLFKVLSATSWTFVLYRGTGYSLSAEGKGYLYLDDIATSSITDPMEGIIKIRPKTPAGVGAGLFYGDRRSGRQCYRVTLDGTSSWSW